jgi:amino acid transporter
MMAVEIAEPDKQPALRRSLALRTIVSTSAGLTFASSTFLVVVYVAYYLAGDSAWIPIVIAGGLCALAAAAFSELNGLYPSASGIRLYIQRAFGERVALVAALTYMSVVALVVGTEAYVLSYVLAAAVPAIAPPIWIFLMLTLATAANFRGLKVAGALQDIITYTVVASIVGMSVWSLSRTHLHVPDLFHPGSVDKVFSAVGFAIFLFVGFEWVTPLAEEVRDARSIARGMFIALVLLTAVYSLLAIAMFAGPDRQALFGTEANRQPIPHILFAARSLGWPGRWLMIVTSIFMSLTTFNAGLISVSRFLYASAREHVLPRRLEHVSVRFATPDAAVFTVYGIALVVSFCVYFTRQYIILVNLAAAAESLIYAFAGASVVALRLKERDKERPFRMWGGVVLPGVTVVLFILIGLGVFLQPGWQTWGAGIVLLAVSLGWWLYVQFIVMPRKERLRAEQAAKRQSRRPVASASGTVESATESTPPPGNETRSE